MTDDGGIEGGAGMRGLSGSGDSRVRVGRAVPQGETASTLRTPSDLDPQPVAPKKRIVRNRARCTKCDTVIESRYRWDWVACKCGTVFVDGGTDYLRRGFDQESDIEELSEFAE